MATIKNTTIDDTGYLKLPVGNSAQRPTGQAGMIRYNTAYSSVEFFNGVNWIAIGGKDGSSAGNAALSGYKLKQDFPNLPNGTYWIKSAAMPNPLEMYCDMTEDGGGYDFYAFAGNGISTNYVTQAHSGTPLGLEIVMARSPGHWKAMSNYIRGVRGEPNNDNYQRWFRTVYGVYKTSSSGNYTGQIMRSPSYYGSGSGDHRVLDGGKWWIRNSSFSEPNGDYTAYAWFGISPAGYTFPYNYNGEDIGFNDANASYATGNYYLVSTNAKP